MRPITTLLSLLALLLSSLPAAADQKPLVVVSLKPIHSLVSGLMEGIGKPELIVTGNNTPLEYKITQNQKDMVLKSDLVVWMGPELEKFLVTTLGKLSAKTKVTEMLANDNFKILHSRLKEGERDPFLWLDVRNAEIFIDELHDELVAIDPKNVAIYKENRKKIKLQVARLDREFEYGFRTIAADVGWAYHDTQQYFEQSYSLRIASSLSPSLRGTADLAKLLTARADMERKGKACFFTEAGMTTEKIDLLTKGSDIVTAQLDSFATQFEPGPALYAKMMNYNFKKISGCYAGIGAKYSQSKEAQKRLKKLYDNNKN
ncbi:MAG: zinc ABC transporter substrate-binding protein [Alphaproteobacteria bacterium]|nr:zinc ABC transporter substrate-binding protein [Alphaproteobacteria bacterium]